MNLRLKFSSDTRELATMRRATRDFLLGARVPEMDAELMVLALDEACTNIIRYAYGGNSHRLIRLAIDCGRGTVRCTLRDYGTSCDPSKIRSRDLTDFRPGGLGVRIMQCAFDQVQFVPKSRGTELTMSKSFGHAAANAATAKVNA